MMLCGWRVSGEGGAGPQHAADGREEGGGGQAGGPAAQEGRARRQQRQNRPGLCGAIKHHPRLA
eukprot:scaffold59609_cov22-Prasinocladus_malaysianus.AAC.1